MVVSLIAHILVENMKKQVNKYKIMKRMLKLLEKASDDDILRIYGYVHTNYCLSCKLKEPSPWGCLKCYVHRVKRECFKKISDREIIYKFLEEKKSI